MRRASISSDPERCQKEGGGEPFSRGSREQWAEIHGVPKLLNFLFLPEPAKKNTAESPSKAIFSFLPQPPEDPTSTRPPLYPSQPPNQLPLTLFIRPQATITQHSQHPSSSVSLLAIFFLLTADPNTPVAGLHRFSPSSPLPLLATHKLSPARRTETIAPLSRRTI